MLSIRRQMQISLSIIAFVLVLLISSLTLFWVNQTFNQNRLRVATSYLLQYAATFNEAISEITLPADIVNNQVSGHYESLAAKGEAGSIESWLPYFDKALTYRDMPKSLVTHIDFYTLSPEGKLGPQNVHYQANPENTRFESGLVESEPLNAEVESALKLMLKNGTESYWLTSDAYANASKSWLKIRLFRYYNQPVLVSIFSGDASSFHINFSQTRLDEKPQLAILSQSGSLIYASNAFDESVLNNSLSSHTIKDEASSQAVKVSQLSGSPQLLLSHVLSNSWQIVYVYSPKSWIGAMGQELGLLILLIFVLIALLSTLGKWAFRRFDQPLHRLELFLDKPSESSDIFEGEKLGTHSSRDEIAQLMDAYKQLSMYIEHSEKDLTDLKLNLEEQSQLKSKEIQQANLLLSRSIEDLERQSLHLEELHEKLSQNVSAINDSRRELLNLEKMSSLKYLVSGVAHELNTPIGNAITIATYLDAEIDHLIVELKQGTPLKKNRFTDSVKTIRTSLHQLLNNLQQGLNILALIEDLVISEDATLVTPVDIAAFIELIAQTHIDNHHHEVKLLIKNTIGSALIDTDPERVRQLLTPLLENSLNHGFKAFEQEQIIQIGLYSEDGHLVIEYSDNGKGVDWNERQYILTPFYSSDFGLRKGLGLNFVYNVVTQYYKGHLSFFDTPLGGLGIRCELDAATLYDETTSLRKEVQP